MTVINHFKLGLFSRTTILEVYNILHRWLWKHCRQSWKDHVCVCSVAQSCLTLCDPLNCSPPGFSIHGVFQARILKRVAVSSSRGFSWPKDWTQVSCVSCIGRQIICQCTSWENLQRIIEYNQKTKRLHGPCCS